MMRVEGLPAPDPMRFKLRRIGIDTHNESIAFVDDDDRLTQSLALSSMDRVEITAGDRRILCGINAVEGTVVDRGTIGLSNAAFAKLGLPEGTEVQVRPAEQPVSVDRMLKRFDGSPLSKEDFALIVGDIVHGRYSKVELTAFVTAVSIHALDDDEVAWLTEAMVEAGLSLSFDAPFVADKHCIGGIPGNRTTPIVTAIAAAAGLVMPKTSSRAITSPAGTADTMEVLMDVELDEHRIRAVVEAEGACLVWGGGLDMAPADDLIIRVERPLDIDSESLMIASILAKKKAAGATHVLLDIPIGPGKAPTREAGERLAQRFELLAERLGMVLKAVLTDGSQPIGRGIGPVLEADDVLRVLNNEAWQPMDLRAKSIDLAGVLLELCEAAAPGKGAEQAEALLESGAAAQAFENIRTAQGRRRLKAPGSQTADLVAASSGTVTAIHNRHISRLAKLAGAPRDQRAGLELYKHVGDAVEAGETLMRVYAQVDDALQFAVSYWEQHPETYVIE